MSLLLESCAGHIHIFPQGKGRKGVGFYSMDPMIKPSQGKCLITGVQLEFQEIMQPTVTLDDTRTIYTFGSAWSEASISGLLLLGDSADGGPGITDLQAWYEANRISVKKKPIALSLAKRGIEAFVAGLQMGEVDPNFNKQAFSVRLLLSKD